MLVLSREMGILSRSKTSDLHCIKRCTVTFFPTNVVTEEFSSTFCSGASYYGSFLTWLPSLNGEVLHDPTGGMHLLSCAGLHAKTWVSFNCKWYMNISTSSTKPPECDNCNQRSWDTTWETLVPQAQTLLSRDLHCLPPTDGAPAAPAHLLVKFESFDGLLIALAFWMTVVMAVMKHGEAWNEKMACRK